MKGSAKEDRALEVLGTAWAGGRLEGLGLSVSLRTSTDPSVGRSGSGDDGSRVKAVDLGCARADLGNPWVETLGWVEGDNIGVEGGEALI
jgi:hypothetical protein